MPHSGWDAETIVTHLASVMSGLTIGAGQALMSGHPASVVVGRALVTSGLAVSAHALFLLFSDIQPLAAVGVSAAVGSLGTSAVEKMWDRILRRAGLDAQERAETEREPTEARHAD